LLLIATKTMLIQEKTKHQWKAESSFSVIMTRSAISENEQKTLPCITVWNTQWGDFTVSTGVLGKRSGHGLSGVWVMLMLLVPWCPVQGTDAGFRTWNSEALTDTVPHLLCIWIHFCKLPYPLLHKTAWKFIIGRLPHWVLEDML
jgi:hypothetical protein